MRDRMMAAPLANTVHLNSMKHTNARLIIISDAMFRPRTETPFENQAVDYTPAVYGSTTGADGKVSTFMSDPAKVFWQGGDVNAFKGATDLRLLAASGGLLIEGPINSNWPPKAVPGGVEILINC